MSSSQGFAPVARDDASVLILGSMPSVVSLQQYEYYAHPRNAFWKIIARLFEFPDNLSYQKRLHELQKHGLSLWDVIQSCERRGSLDSNINAQSVIGNDFAAFFERHPHIGHLFFNGSRAEQEYLRRVLPELPERLQQLPRTRLPSTSPAMASLSFEQKLHSWKQVKLAVKPNFQCEDLTGFVSRVKSVAPI